VKELSYGQKRQLEVAIALCAEPRILLMDEPAAGTSPQERGRLVSLINALPRDLTIVLVEHDMDVVFAICDVITVLSYGKLLATGTRDQVQNDPAVIEAYLGRRHA
jgi:branched-chain amino acid transport system ATP-binding protein